MMWSALRWRRLLPPSSVATIQPQQWRLGFPLSCPNRALSASASEIIDQKAILDLQEVEKVLSDVRAGDVRVIPMRKQCDWADYMVVASGRSAWHVKNIAQALIYKAKQKQKGARRLTLPSVEGGNEGKWIVVDSGKIIVHALDEKARAYYNLESLWTTGNSQKQEANQDLEKAFVKIRRKNNSKKPANNSA